MPATINIEVGNMDDAGIDFAIVTWFEDDQWQVIPAPSSAITSIDALERFARQHQGTSGTVALASVADEFFVVIRIQGARIRRLLSDVAAALDWSVAEEVLTKLDLDIDVEDVEDLPDGEPAGDLNLLDDYGVTSADLDVLCADLEMYPDEQIGVLATKVGFANALAQVVDGALA